MPKVSVIIPVYNVEPYLRECLDSVINQTLRDIEILCIEDCSADNSLDILEEYARKDSRITVLQNEVNSGLSMVRNRGISEAKGEYIQFLDSDDYIPLDAMEKLYLTAKEHDLDLLKPQFRFVRQQNGGVPKYSEEIIKKVCTGQQLLCELEKDPNVRTEGWLNFVKTEFIRQNNIRFYPGIYYEDELFCFDVYMHAQRGMCLNDVAYIYRIRSGSITGVSVSQKHLESRIISLEQLVKRYAGHKFDFQFQLAAMSYFYKVLERRSAYAHNLLSALDMTEWRKDMIDTYQTLFSFLDTYSAVWDNLKRLKASKVYIYGAGMMAEKFMRALNAYDIAVEGVLVTSLTSGRTTFMGHRVRTINEADVDPERDVVILAVTERYQDEMLDALRRKGIRHIISYRF